MNKEKITAVGIDYNKTLERFADNEKLFEKFLLRYKEDTHYQEGKAAFEKGDYQEVLKQIHALKGVTGTLGMEALYEAASHVVEIIRGKEQGDLQEAMEQLEKEQENILTLFAS